MLVLSCKLTVSSESCDNRRVFSIQCLAGANIWNVISF